MFDNNTVESKAVAAFFCHGIKYPKQQQQQPTNQQRYFYSERHYHLEKCYCCMHRVTVCNGLC